jgi:hypothetical protein
MYRLETQELNADLIEICPQAYIEKITNEARWRRMTRYFAVVYFFGGILWKQLSIFLWPRVISASRMAGDFGI